MKFSPESCTIRYFVSCRTDVTSYYFFIYQIEGIDNEEMLGILCQLARVNSLGREGPKSSV
jgi:hypothetical protein